MDLNPDSAPILCGFTIAEFDQLEELFHIQLQPAGEGKQGRRVQRLVSTHDRLILLLHWLKFADNYTRIANTFGIARTTAFETLRYLVQAVSPVAKAAFIHPASVAQQRGWRALPFPDALLVIDTTMHQERAGLAILFVEPWMQDE